MKFLLFLAVGLSLLSCSQNEDATSIQSNSFDARINAQINEEGKLMQMAGFPARHYEQTEWAKGRNYEEADRMIGEFLAKNRGKLSANELEIFNRSASCFILDEMQLVDSQNQSKIKEYLTIFFKTGGNNIPLMWKGLMIAKRNHYWDQKMEAEATWLLDLVIDTKIQKYNRDMAANQKEIVAKVPHRALLVGDNKRMTELLSEYKRIKQEITDFPRSQPISKEAFMTSINY